MRAMGFRPTEEELKELLIEIDEDGSGEIEFGEFSSLLEMKIFILLNLIITEKSFYGKLLNIEHYNAVCAEIISKVPLDFYTPTYHFLGKNIFLNSAN